MRRSNLAIVFENRELGFGDLPFSFGEPNWLYDIWPLVWLCSEYPE